MLFHLFCSSFFSCTLKWGKIITQSQSRLFQLSLLITHMYYHTSSCIFILGSCVLHCLFEAYSYACMAYNVLIMLLAANLFQSFLDQKNTCLCSSVTCVSTVYAFKILKSSKKYWDKFIPANCIQDHVHFVYK